MMIPTTVTQEAARMRTRQQVREADAFRTSKALRETRSSGRRSAWAAIAAAFPARRPASGPTPETVPVTATSA